MESEVDPGIVEYYRSQGRSEAQARHLAKLNGGNPLVKLKGDAEPLLARLRAGETVAQIAAGYGISQPAVYQWLLRNAASEWAEVAASNSLVRLEAAERVVEDAREQVDVSRGSTMIKNEQWKLERLLPKVFGGQQGGGGGVQITVNLDRSCGGSVVVDGGGHSAVVSSGGAEASDGTVFKGE